VSLALNERFSIVNNFITVAKDIIRS